MITFFTPYFLNDWMAELKVVLEKYQWICLAVTAVLMVISIGAQWRMFKKLGQPGWQSLIPLYRQYVWGREIWRDGIGWLLMITTAFAYVAFLAAALIDSALHPALHVRLLMVSICLYTFAWTLTVCIRCQMVRVFQMGPFGFFLAVYAGVLVDWLIGFGKWTAHQEIEQDIEAEQEDEESNPYFDNPYAGQPYAATAYSQTPPQTAFGPEGYPASDPYAANYFQPNNPQS